MDRKHEIQHLQEALDYSENILATIREPLLVLDAGLRILYANQSFYKVFSLTPGETEGKLIYEVSDGQWNIPVLRHLLENILPRNTSFDDYEVDHEFPELGRRTMLLNARRMHDGGEKTQRILLAIEDITARKRMEEQITTSELRYRRLFEAAQDGILILDAGTGGITDVNPFLTKMLGYTAQDLKGKKLWEIGFFQDADASRRAFKTLQDKGYVRYEDLPLKTRDGKPMQVEFVSNLYPVNGSHVIQCNIRDITERKKTERMRDEFIGVISHEIKTPLTIIKGDIVNAVNKKATPQQANEFLGDAIEEVEVIVNLVDNLLELARQQSGRLVLRTQPVDIGEVAENVISRLHGDLTKHRFITDVTPELPLVLVDSVRVERIVHNLLDNAVKYSPEGGEVRVSARRDGNFLVVSVADQGPGIAENDQKRLFQSFERLDRTTDETVRGTGLGLRVCRILVEAHKGKIWVESAPGQGSTFFFTLPVAK